MKKLFYILSLFFCGVYFTSCQKVVDIDLNSAEPKIVIDAEIKNGYGCIVGVTRTVNFDEKNEFPPVRNAVVELSDNAGNTETLTESASIPGLYLSQTLMGVAGRTYVLKVTVDGVTYTATETMPMPVAIDSVNVQQGFFRERRNLLVYFTDPVNIENYYRLVYLKNNKTSTNLYITEDLLRDGKQIDATMFIPDEDSLRTGDSVLVSLRNIDKGSYDYFRTMSNADGGGDPGATPANPLSNFNNGALGYFSVYSEEEMPFIVP